MGTGQERGPSNVDEEIVGSEEETPRAAKMKTSDPTYRQSRPPGNLPERMCTRSQSRGGQPI